MTTVHPEFEHAGSFSHLKLGRQEPRPDIRTLRLASYLDLAALPPIPALMKPPGVKNWPMYGNDRYGDCTVAAAGHMIQGWTKAVGHQRTPATTTIERAYWSTGDGADTGRVELDVLNYWRNHGIGKDKITAFVQVDPLNLDHVKAAIYLFGGVYTGIGLPLSAQGHSSWDLVGLPVGRNAPWSWGGHAVPYVGYDAAGVTLVTWGGLLNATWRFHTAYTDEVWAIISPDFMNVAGSSPAGFNLAALQADLAALKAH